MTEPHPEPDGNSTPLYNEIAQDNPGAAQQMDQYAASQPMPDTVAGAEAPDVPDLPNSE